jgi:hypothetical protein
MVILNKKTVNVRGRVSKFDQNGGGSSSSSSSSSNSNPYRTTAFPPSFLASREQREEYINYKACNKIYLYKRYIVYTIS